MNPQIERLEIKIDLLEYELGEFRYRNDIAIMELKYMYDQKEKLSREIKEMRSKLALTEVLLWFVLGIHAGLLIIAWNAQ